MQSFPELSTSKQRRFASTRTSRMLEAAGHAAAVGVGGIGGGAVGLVLGAVGGPIGMATGAVTGAVAGGIAGEMLVDGVVEAIDVVDHRAPPHAAP